MDDVQVTQHGDFEVATARGASGFTSWAKMGRIQSDCPIKEPGAHVWFNFGATRDEAHAPHFGGVGTGRMSGMINLYVGFDPRTEIGYHTFVSSVLHCTSVPVGIVPLDQTMLRSVWKAGHRDGSNAFTYLRFLVPFLNSFSGWAVFADGSDMVMRGDLAELWELRNHHKAVQVVKHHYSTKHPKKYVGTAMEAVNEDYDRKNWSSLMLINCSHFSWRDLTPELVGGGMPGEDLQSFKFIRTPQQLGELPLEWNWLVDEYGENPHAKLLHWTTGIPAFPQYTNAPMADVWARAALQATHVTI